MKVIEQASFEQEVGRVVECMRCAVLSCERFDGVKVGLLGSAALAYYQLLRGIGPVWWKEWPPGDFDFFLVGPRSKHGCEMAAVQVVRHFVASLEHPEKVVWNRFAVQHTGRGVVHVNNLLFESTKVQITECPMCTKLEDVAAAFDIDVCRVIYEPTEKKFHAIEASTKENIANGRAAVDSIYFEEEGHPSAVEVGRISQTLKRMRKHSERGFEFTGVKGVHFS